MFKKIYLHDERKFFFDCFHIDNKLSVEDSLKALREFKDCRDLKKVNVYIFVFEFDKRIKCTIYKNKKVISKDQLKVIEKEKYFKFKENYVNYLKEKGVIKRDN